MVATPVAQTIRICLDAAQICRLDQKKEGTSKTRNVLIVEKKLL